MTLTLLNEVSVGITHVDGRVIFKDHHKKWAKTYFSICHYDSPFDKNSIPSIWAIFPRDYDRPLMLVTIKVDPVAKYCEKATVCLDFKCELNRFDKGAYLMEFVDCGMLTLGLPKNFGEIDLWFNEGKWRQKWKDFMIPIDGGTLKFKEDD